jgi:hypothetical protein
MSKISNALYLSAIASPALLLAASIGGEHYSDYLKEKEKARILSLSPEDLTLRDVAFIGSKFNPVYNPYTEAVLSPWGEDKILIEGFLDESRVQALVSEKLKECRIIKVTVIKDSKKTEVAEVDGPREPCLGLVYDSLRLIPSRRIPTPSPKSKVPSKEREFIY